MAKKKKQPEESEGRLTERFKDGREVINDDIFLSEVANALRQNYQQRSNVLNEATKTKSPFKNDIRLKRSAIDEIEEIENNNTNGKGIRAEFIRDEFIAIATGTSSRSHRVREFISHIGTKAFYATLAYYEKKEQTTTKPVTE